MQNQRQKRREGGRRGPERQLPSGHSRWQTHVKCFIRVSLSPRKGGYKFYKFAAQLKKRRRRVENINAQVSYLPTAAAAAAQDEQGQGEEASRDSSSCWVFHLPSCGHRLPDAKLCLQSFKTPSTCSGLMDNHLENSRKERMREGKRQSERVAQLVRAAFLSHFLLFQSFVCFFVYTLCRCVYFCIIFFYP